MTTAKNLWYNPSSAYSRKVYEYPGKRLLFYRGVEVYKNPYGSWDYIFNGAAITQRAGFNPSMGKDVIDSILDGTSEIPLSDAVASHIQQSMVTA